jgi:DNA mismatch endonuclease (patch repair protein)
VGDWLTPEQRQRNMSSIRSTNTAPERRLEKLLVDMFKEQPQLIQHPPELMGRPDWILPEYSLVLFADGCFWHGCPKHGRIPEDNGDYWGPKIARNRQRDRRVSRELRSQGFIVVRVWDHELRGRMNEARTKIRRALRMAKARENSNVACRPNP